MKNVTSVKIFSTTWCPYCKMEEAWLKDKKVPHTVVMIEEDPAAAAHIEAATGQRGVPVTEISYDDGPADFVIGFDRTTLTELLKLS
jgi:glutaredoxin